ncbi:hypothetical protein F5X97DRAFT_219919 [Nemania serpens]|nr:hypothetical protein F5X97DRAFT_219919 [Nemania serpens]
MILCSLGSLVLLGRTTNSRFRKSKITWPADSAGKYPFASYTIVINQKIHVRNNALRYTALLDVVYNQVASSLALLPLIRVHSNATYQDIVYNRLCH